MTGHDTDGPLQWFNAGDPGAESRTARDTERREQEEREREERDREDREREDWEREERDREEREREDRERTAAPHSGGGAGRAGIGTDRREQIEDHMASRHGRRRAGGGGPDIETAEAEPSTLTCSPDSRVSAGRPAAVSGAVYGGDPARRIKSRLGSLAATGLKALGKAGRTRVGRPAATREPKPSPQRDDPRGERGALPASPEGLEERLKLSLREAFVGRTSRIPVGSPKGGVGKSSIAYGVAGAVAYFTNMRVVLVDADPNFGSTRLLVPRPVKNSVVDLARDADRIEGLSDIRAYVAQNEKMRLDVALGPEHPCELAEFEDLSEAYGRIDSVLGRFYDVIVYDLGLGFRDPAIRSILSFSNELLFVSDSEVIPNAMLGDAISYMANLGVDLGRTTLALNHRLPPTDESAATEAVRTAHGSHLRRVTEIPYDPEMSRLLNRRAFHIDDLSLPTRLGLLTTVAATLEGLKHAGDDTVARGAFRYAPGYPVGSAAAGASAGGAHSRNGSGSYQR